MAEIDLKPFCSTDPFRPYLMQPWSRGGYTYATNGHILVRVALRDDVPDNSKAPDAETVIAACGKHDMRSLPKYMLPKEKLTPCEKCSGTGNRHPCPECTCGSCDSCDGNGVEFDDTSVAVGQASVAARYLRLLSRLPNIQVPHWPQAGGPMPFTFDGGTGVLMTMTRQYTNHIEEPPRG